MYRYDSVDQTLVDERVRQFRDQTRRFLAGDLSEEEFRPLRLQNGLYIQRHAPMLRVAIPYGVLSSPQLATLGDIAERYDRGFGHFTTRQNIQYNWPELADVPDILADLARVEMHAIQTSGNCVRNITSDHLAGVYEDEIEDPRPYCEILRQWSTFHPEFAYLPRKFKIAVSGSESDRAATRVHDIGLQILRGENGETGFRVLVGGGLGRLPMLGETIREFLPARHLLSYCEAILRVYNLLGRRDNIHKARIKVLVRALGIDEFRDRVEREWAHFRDDPERQLDTDAIEHMREFFAPPAFADSVDPAVAVDAAADNESFRRWLERNTVAHKQPGYRAAYVALKSPGVPPGDATGDQMRRIAALAERFSFGEIRVSHQQNLLLPHVRDDHLPALWKALSAEGLGSPAVGTLQDMICCPGLDFCSLANATSIPVATAITERFDDIDYLYDLGELRLNLSGCMNACGHHHVAHIGILGVDKRGEEFYQITLGGSSREDTALGERLGPAVPRADVVGLIERLLDTYVAEREADETFLETYRRVGMTPFKESAYGPDHSRSRHRRGRVDSTA